MRKVAIIGTVGVPANYGGFETLVENIIGEYCPNEIQYTVYCSSKAYNHKLSSYKNAKLQYLNLSANGVQSIVYDIVSLLKATSHNDIILVLGVSGCCFLPIYRIFSKKKLVINIDGLEHRREKWSKWARRFLKFSEKMAIKYGDIIVTDNKGIQDYVKSEYNQVSELIEYGGDHVKSLPEKSESNRILNEYNLIEKENSFSVCRIEPENNVHIVLEAFKQSGKKIVFVGNWSKSDYGVALLKKYENESNIILLSPIYDLKILGVLRSNCLFYIHGHSAGGTNPSLVEAMFFARPILAFDVVYNRETTENCADYFSSIDTLVTLLNKTPVTYERNGKKMLEIAKQRYIWKSIVDRYVKLF